MDLVVQVGTEVVSQTTSALERVDAMVATGRIDRAGLRLLREEVQAARRSAMLGLQVHRVSRGRVAANADVVDVSAMLRQLLAQRGRELAASELQARQALDTTVVPCDPVQLRAMLSALLDWTIEHARDSFELRLGVVARPASGELQCSLRHGLTLPTQARVTQALETLSWRLVKASARSLGFDVTRQDSDTHSLVMLRMPDAASTLPAVDVAPVGAESAANSAGDSINSRPLAGSHVLAVSGRREVRSIIREVARPLGVMLDFVGSVEEAREFCLGGLPHALIFESALGGGYMRRLLAELLQESPALAAIEIVEEGKAFEVYSAGGHELSRVSKSALATALPQALMFELCRER